MGQYYMPAIIDKINQVKTLYAHDFDNGLKLTEHSWIGNYFVNAVISLIYKNPRKVAWIGDYSDDQLGDAYEKKIQRDDFMRYYEMVWNQESNQLPRGKFTERDTTILEHDTVNMYIVNNSMQQYIDIGKYIKNNTYDGWCVNPLPILTACGNGRGGGDYRGINSDMVGSWAFDLIEYTDTVPESYKEINYNFRDE